jgi:hypothetical protein
MVNYEQDYRWGEEQEKKVYPIIKDTFEGIDNLIKGNRFSTYDYWTEDTDFELKSRKNKYKAYPTTMITRNKITDTTKEQLILLFNFTDGLYFIQYDEELFSKFTVTNFSRADRQDDEKAHVYIPIEHLELIKKW